MPIEWNSLLSKPEVLSVLRWMVAKGVDSVEPTVNQRGDISYLVGDSGGGAIEVLESMVKTGVFEKKSGGRLLGCPEHEGSVDLVPLLRCPHCSSTQLAKGALSQHTCGYIGAPEAFAAGCPGCKKPASPQTLKPVGTWFECESCHKKSAVPNLYLFCKRYNHEFTLNQVRILDRATYTLTGEAKAALRGRFGIIISVFDGLTTAGAKVDMPGRLAGNSGVMHDFDLLVDGEVGKIPIDVNVSDSGAVDVVGVLSTYAKALDTKATPTLLVAVPSASADARKTAGAYGMVLIEGGEAKAITEKILASIRAGPPSAEGQRAPA